MYRRLIGATLLLGVFALSLVDVRARVPEKQDNPAPTAKDSDTLPAGEYYGTLKTTPASDRTFTVTTEQKKLVPTGKGTTGRPTRAPSLVGYSSLNGALAQVYNLQNQYVKAQNQAAAAKSQKSQQKAQQKAQQIGSQLQQAAVTLQAAALAVGIRNTAILLQSAGGIPNFRIDMTKQDIDFQATDEVKVRTMNLPEQFDEKGNPKKYTEKEKAELKGKDKTLPGYESSLDKLEAGQKVKVVLAAVKKKPADDKDAEKDKDKDKDAEKDKDKDPEKKKQVKMIVIIEEATADNPKKKKNN